MSGFASRSCAERNATAFTTRKLADVGVPRGQSQRVGSNLQRAVEIPPVHRVDFGGEVALALEQCGHLFVAHGLRKLVRNGVVLVDEVDDRLHAALDVAANVQAVVELRLLREISDVDVLLRPRFAVKLFIDPCHDPQQAGLTGAVQTEHTDLCARKEGQ